MSLKQKLVGCAGKAGRGLLPALLWAANASLILSAVNQLLCSENNRKRKIQLSLPGWGAAFKNKYPFTYSVDVHSRGASVRYPIHKFQI